MADVNRRRRNAEYDDEIQFSDSENEDANMNSFLDSTTSEDENEMELEDDKDSDVDDELSLPTDDEDEEEEGRSRRLPRSTIRTRKMTKNVLENLSQRKSPAQYHYYTEEDASYTEAVGECIFCHRVCVIPFVRDPSRRMRILFVERSFLILLPVAI